MQEIFEIILDQGIARFDWVFQDGFTLCSHDVVKSLFLTSS
jgi:hypothetical protein